MSRVNWRRRALAIDLGTSNTRIYLQGRGVAVVEPTAVAIRESGEPVAIGTAASRMVGRTPGEISLVRPLIGGAIADIESTETLLRSLFPPAPLLRRMFRPLALVTVPSDLTSVERRAVYEATLFAGARDVLLIPKVMAAAIGAGLPVTQPSGNLVLDIGGGTTEVAVLSLSGIVCSNSTRTGGEAMNAALMAYMKRKYNLLIGDPTAELLKIRIGTAYPTDDMSSLEVRGRDLISGNPRAIEIQAEETREALTEPIADIVDSVRTTLESTPPELAADIAERGIVMVGGGSLLRHLDLLLREATGLPVVVIDDPMNAVALGAGRVVDDRQSYRDVTFTAA